MKSFLNMFPEFSGIVINPMMQSAVTEDQMRQQIAYQNAMMRGSAGLQDPLAMMNWRRPVHVPQGYADWYACGDDLR